MTAATTTTARARNVPRVAFGAALLLAWAVLTVVWVASTVTSGSLIIKGLIALALMALLAAMEGLEVAVIDRWREMYPERGTKLLAGWLAARQLFVALIVTTATILADRERAHPARAWATHGRHRGQALRDRLDGLHRPVVRADPPEAHGRDQPRSLSPAPAEDVLPDRRRRPDHRGVAAGRVDGARARAQSGLACDRAGRSRRVHRRGARTRSQRPGARSDHRKSMPPAFSRGSSTSIQSGTA